MTVSSASNKTIASGNGVATTFTFPWIGVAAGDITVIYTDTAGVETTLVQGTGPTQYQVALNAVLPNAIWGIGGTITYNPSGTPIAVGTTLTIYRTVPLTQAVALQNQASFGQNASAIEQALDLNVMQVQQTAEQIGRALQMSITNSRAPVELPPADQAAGLALIFSPDGLDVIAGNAPASGVISSAMQPVVSAASLAAGRTAFGLQDMAVEDIGAGLQDDGAGAVRVNSAITQDSINQAVTSAFHLTRRAATGPITYTFPRANTLWNGFGFWIDAFGASRTAVITLTIDANDNFKGQPSGGAIFVPPNSSCFVTTDHAASGIWYIDWMPVVIPLAAKSNAGELYGLTLANNAGDATNDIDFAVGTARDALDTLDLIGTALTKRLDADWAAGTNQGMRYSGAAITNTTYHLFVIGTLQGLTDYFAYAASTDPTAVLPTGYVKYRRIGSILREAGAIVGFVQDGDSFQRKTLKVDVAAATSEGTAAITRTLSVPLGINVMADIQVDVNNGTGTVAAYLLTDLATTDEAPTSALADLNVTLSTFGALRTRVRTNTSAQIRSRCSISGVALATSINTRGWVDSRGRNAA